MNTKFTIDYICSKDEQDFLKCRDYEPTVTQAAFFISSNAYRIPFKDQEEAFLKLMETNEDEPYEDTTVFTMINNLISKTKEVEKELAQSDENTYYTYMYNCAYNSVNSYRTLEDCKKAAHHELDYPYRDDKDAILKIYKRKFDEVYYDCSVTYGKDENGELALFNVRDFENPLMMAPKLDVPHPFRVGDFVRNKHWVGIIYQLPNESNQYTLKTVVLANNQNVLVEEYNSNMFTLEYCKGIRNEQAILIPIGEYLRGEIYIDDMLLQYSKIRQKTLCEDLEVAILW